MNTSFDDVLALAESRYRDAFARGEDNAFSLSGDGLRLDFFGLPGEPATAAVRARVLSLADIPRAADFAKACLAGNFFWGGTRGATLSVGAGDALYLTERRPAGELADAEGLDGCIADFANAVSDWRERSALYE